LVFLWGAVPLNKRNITIILFLGARTRITENTYALLKGKWRILKHARNHVDNFLNIVTGRVENLLTI